MSTVRKPSPKGRSLQALSATVLVMAALGTAAADDAGRMTLHSATFEDGGTLPLSMINTMLDTNGQNICTPDGMPGGNQSPQLTWKNAPENTQSFVVIVYDVTAQFTHWAMYDIPAGTTRLPANAGTPGSGYGTQNGNDFFVAGYDGPCPPTTFTPHVHQYTVTVYALDIFLRSVPAFGDFVPPGPEGLYHELLSAAREGHVLGSARIVGHYSAVAQ
jgi:Raf kinase inhibitor-like YbhB/YbcL family protein